MSSATNLHYNALLEWVGHHRLGVAGTVTFRPAVGRGYLKPEYLNARHAQKCVSQLLRRLDRAAFGTSGVRKGKLVGAIAVREGSDGWSNKHVHYHLALDVPARYCPEEWADVARRTWTALEWASPEQNRFEPMWSDQWLSYIFKTRDKPVYLDAMDIENWRLVKR
jgi:hypothetical protein